MWKLGGQKKQKKTVFWWQLEAKLLSKHDLWNISFIFNIKQEI